MELEILESKKGTKVVTASNLHLVLGLPNHHYGTNVRRWVRDAYEFLDGIRKPEDLRDFSRRVRANQPMDDFYLTLEMARLIALRTNSKEKMKFARFLSLAGRNFQMDLFSAAAA
jgi:phage anti-repressor protein